MAIQYFSLGVRLCFVDMTALVAVMPNRVCEDDESTVNDVLAGLPEADRHNYMINLATIL